MGSGNPTPTLPSSEGRGVKRRLSDAKGVSQREALDGSLRVIEEKNKKGGGGEVKGEVGGVKGEVGEVEGEVGGRSSCADTATAAASASASASVSPVSRSQQNSSHSYGGSQGNGGDVRADAERGDVEEGAAIAGLGLRKDGDEDDVKMGQVGGQVVVGLKEEGRENREVGGREKHVEEKQKEQQGERGSTCLAMENRTKQEAEQNDDGLQRKTLVVTRHGQTLEVSCTVHIPRSKSSGAPRRKLKR